MVVLSVPKALDLPLKGIMVYRDLPSSEHGLTGKCPLEPTKLTLDLVAYRAASSSCLIVNIFSDLLALQEPPSHNPISKDKRKIPILFLLTETPHS